MSQERTFADVFHDMFDKHAKTMKQREAYEKASEDFKAKAEFEAYSNFESFKAARWIRTKNRLRKVGR